MKEKDIPKYKMTDAIPEPPDTTVHPQDERPGQSPETPHPSEMREHNAQVNQGYQHNNDRLVDIGRGEQTTGRM